MPVTSLDWIKDPDVAANFVRGLQIGSSVAEANARIQAQQEEVSMRAQARQDALQQQALQENARIETQKSYHEQQLGIQQQRLQQIGELNAIRTRDAAMKVAGQQRFNELVKGGMAPEQAIWEAGLGTASTAMQGAALSLREQGLGVRQERLASQEAAQKVAQEQRDRALNLREQQINQGSPMTVTVHQRDANDFPIMDVHGSPQAVAAQLGTNAPPALRTTAPAFKNPAEVQSAFRAGKLSKADASAILRDKFGFK